MHKQLSYNATRVQDDCSIVLHPVSMLIVRAVSKVELYHTMSGVHKNCAKLFLSELRKSSNNFDNFWQKDGKEAEIMRGALIAHLT